MEIGADRLNKLYNIKKNIFVLGYRGRLGSKIMEIGNKDESLNMNSIKSITTYTENANNNDIIIDVSSPSGTYALIEGLLYENKNPKVIIGTTEIEDCYEIIDKYNEKENKALIVPNFSKGINIMKKLISEVNKYKKDWKTSMTEIHHIHKKDSPSGTAKMLSNLLDGFDSNEIVSIREGEDYGTHIIKIEKEDECIEIKHQALSRNIFANGAIEIVKNI